MSSSNANLATKERRLMPRKRLTGLMPGRMVNMKTERNISCRPIDISDHGLGILTAEEISDGTQLILVLPHQSIKFKILWQKPDFGKNNLVRYGLGTEDPELNIASVFEDAGCLK